MKVNINVYVKEPEAMMDAIRVMDDLGITNVNIVLENKERFDNYWNIYGEVEYDKLDNLVHVLQAYELKDNLYD